MYINIYVICEGISRINISCFLLSTILNVLPAKVLGYQRNIKRSS